MIKNLDSTFKVLGVLTLAIWLATFITVSIRTYNKNMSKDTKPTIKHVRTAEADALEVKRTYLLNRGWEETGDGWHNEDNSLDCQTLDNAIERQEALDRAK